MAKTKYRINQDTLEYEKVEIGLKGYMIRGLALTGVTLLIGFIMFMVAITYIDSPKEKQLKAEYNRLLDQYDLLNKRMDDMENVLADIENRDDNVYRTIFEAEPIPKEVRQSGFGGSWGRYKQLQRMDNADLVVNTSKRADMLTKRLYIQSKSFDDVIKMAKQKEKMLASIPAIQPVSNKDLTRVASGYGYRTDPIYKTTKFHAGMDFTAPTGTPIYATGDGVVVRADTKSSGYGRHVRINHGYGYVTLYAHMTKMLVKPNQKVKRGDIIGLIGCTGKCVGPHLHYEVRKNGNPINPVNFYFNDLAPDEYDMMIQLSSAPTQALD